MCESLRPGITVRPFPSMILVLGPRSLKISWSLPIAMIFPSVTATASAKEGTPFVAILALYNIVSAGIKISLVQQLLLKLFATGGPGIPALGPAFLVSELRQATGSRIREISKVVRHGPWCTRTPHQCHMLPCAISRYP